jgi:hypothetical protein
MIMFLLANSFCFIIFWKFNGYFFYSICWCNSLFSDEQRHHAYFIEEIYSWVIIFAGSFLFLSGIFIHMLQLLILLFFYYIILDFRHFISFFAPWLLSFYDCTNFQFIIEGKKYYMLFTFQILRTILAIFWLYYMSSR